MSHSNNQEINQVNLYFSATPAGQLNLTYLRFRQGERLELLLAEQVASGADAHRRGPLLAELAAANRLVNPGSTGATGNSAPAAATPPSSDSPTP